LDILRLGDPIVLVGSGWFEPETFKGDTFRWVSNDAGFNVARLRSNGLIVKLLAEPGPGLDLKPFELKVLDGASKLVAVLKVAGRQIVSFDLPGGKPGVDCLTLHLDESGKPSHGDSRILNFRIFKIEVEPAPSEIVPTSLGLRLGSGWYPLETFNGTTFRWAGNESIVEVEDPQKVGSIRLDIEPGPGVGSGPFKLSVIEASGVQLVEVDVRKRQQISIPLPKTNALARLRLQVKGGGLSAPGDTRILNFRVFSPVD